MELVSSYFIPKGQFHRTQCILPLAGKYSFLFLTFSYCMFLVVSAAHNTAQLIEQYFLHQFLYFYGDTFLANNLEICTMYFALEFLLQPTLA